jgi:hypothetical protein
MIRLRTLLTCLAFGCGGSEVVTLEPTSTEYPEVGMDSVVIWGADDLLAQLNRLALLGLPTAVPVLEGYLGLMQLGDSQCPGDPYELNPDLTEGCLSSTGYYYSGIAEFFPTEDFDFVFENIQAETIQLPDLSLMEPANASFLVGDFEILRVDGIPFSAGGWVMDGRFFRTGQNILFGGITGSWRDANGLTDWHRSGVSGLYLYQLDGSPGQYRLWMDGVLTIHDLHLRFENVEVSEFCPQGFSGLIGIRDPNGLWHELQSSESCGCASLTSAGEQQDTQLCVSFFSVLERYASHLESL